MRFGATEVEVCPFTDKWVEDETKFEDRKEKAHATQLEDALAAIHNSKLILAHQLFATLSSDEFKKTAAAKKNLCGCRSNWRLEAKKSPVVPGK